MDTHDDLERDGQENGPAGIIIRDHGEAPPRPLVSAFIWGGRVRPVPTLPFGRWKATPTAA